MNVQFKKGVLELCVLILTSHKDRYGYELVEEISKKFEISEGGIYPLLRRMTKEELFSTYLSESKEGPPRKYYAITEKGLLLKDELLKEWTHFTQGFKKLFTGRILMTENQYISVLQQHLKDIPAHEQEEFINDYKEHFVLGMEEGRSEEEIADRLGPPEKTAKEIRAQYQLTAAEQKPTYKSVSKAVFAAVSLGLFNLIFILGPLLALISIPIALLITAGTLVISPLLLLIQEGIGQSYWNKGFLMIGYVGVGLLLGIGTMKLIQWMYSLILRYVKFNLRMVRSESK